MPRMSRMVVAGTPHHVTQRSNRRQQTFFRDAVYMRYLELAAERCAKAEVECWGYCLMPNHVPNVPVHPLRGGEGLCAIPISGPTL